jgi:hypothetical protein
MRFAYLGRWWCWKKNKVYWQGVVEEKHPLLRIGLGKRIWEGSKVYDDEPFDSEEIQKEIEKASDSFKATKVGWIWDEPESYEKGSREKSEHSANGFGCVAVQKAPT